MRIAMAVEYDGTELLGFQRQTHGPTVQSALETALAYVADQPIVVHGAGRTDAGVHAFGQVIHFDTERDRSARAWTLGTNSNLMPSVVVRWSQTVSDEFHARFSATGRRYRYRIINRSVRPAIDRHWGAHVRQPLDANRMHEAAQCLLGEHDFSAFRAQSCGARHPVRTLTRIDATRRGDTIELVVAGNAFLHHMVRNIVGSLIAVGRGEQDINWLAQLLAQRDRRKAGVTAPAAGLCLESVDYPAQFGLPSLRSP